ncbi:hypothetical protein CHRYSEOSP005_05510 [Chryseobacterium sp. Alg-005]|uniref:hypothetical protein n=1 Tax=Chryseobacterium sp. Alg-005 TaxID=3159516 RepID=UPI0035556D82
MNKIFFILTLVSCFLSAQQNQIGINTATPSAMLDIVSKDNTNITKALEVNNSSATELVKVTNAGNVGINIGASVPAALLHVNSAGSLNIRHENLPALSSPAYTPPFNKLGIDGSFNGVGVPGTVKYLYYQQASNYPSTYTGSPTFTGGFSLYDSNQYTNIPIGNDVGLKGNTAGFTFGTDATATVNGQVVSNVKYVIIPEPGVYSFEFWGSLRCNRYNSTQNYTLTGQMQVNTVFATASGTTYTTNTIARGILNSTRDNSGNTTNTSYAFANPQVLTQVLQTTVPNQKIALFLQYISGEPNQFTHDECYLNVPAGSNTSYYLIVTKM